MKGIALKIRQWTAPGKRFRKACDLARSLFNRPWDDLMDDGNRLIDLLCWIALGYAVAVMLFQMIRYFVEAWQ